MDDAEHQSFERWFQEERIRSWKRSRPDRAHEPPSEAYMMGLRGWLLAGWLARASITSISAQEAK